MGHITTVAAIGRIVHHAVILGPTSLGYCAEAARADLPSGSEFPTGQSR